MIKVATIIKPHGVKGACKVRAHIENPTLFNKLTEVYVKKGDDYSRVTVKSACFNVGKSSIMSFVDIEDMQAIEKMRNNDIFIPTLPEIEEDETYYYTDLLDLKVCYQRADGTRVPTQDFVSAVEDFGANSVLVIKHKSNDAGVIDVLINFTPSIVLAVDLKFGTIVVNQENFLQMAAINSSSTKQETNDEL